MEHMDLRDTPDRSLIHWNRGRTPELNSFYRLADEDNRLLALAVDWDRFLRGDTARVPDEGRHGSSLRLLDVGCGLGKFPRNIQRQGGFSRSLQEDVAYSLLDASEFSLAAAARVLSPPLMPADRYRCLIQDFRLKGVFDVVWAVHSLYAVPPNEIDAALHPITAALAPGGAGFIAQSSKQSHYYRFHETYLREFRHGNGTSYATSEDIVKWFTMAGMSVNVANINYHAEISAADRPTLEGYLRHCIFDDSLTLTELERRPNMVKVYLEECLDRNRGTYRFQQHVQMIFFGISTSFFHRILRGVPGVTVHVAPGVS
jgi:SAM-dependent methyltransferase